MYSLKRLSPDRRQVAYGPLCHVVPFTGYLFDKPLVGHGLKIGSSEGWWMTTEITEIVSEEPDKIVFKTHNSDYEWTTF